MEVAIEKCDAIIAALMKSATTTSVKFESHTDEDVCNTVDAIYKIFINGEKKMKIDKLTAYVRIENLRHDLRRRDFTMSDQLPEDLVEIKG